MSEYFTFFTLKSYGVNWPRDFLTEVRVLENEQVQNIFFIFFHSLLTKLQ